MDGTQHSAIIDHWFLQDDGTLTDEYSKNRNQSSWAVNHSVANEFLIVCNVFAPYGEAI